MVIAAGALGLPLRPLPRGAAGPRGDARSLRDLDGLIRASIEDAAAADNDYWSTWTAAERNVQRYFQYPAMMVPAMQRELLQIVTSLMPEVRAVVDPFAGSGTVVSEAMLAGLDVVAQDINPLAVLLCRVRSGPFDVEGLRNAAAKVTSTAATAIVRRSEAPPGTKRWFSDNAARELAALRSVIAREPELWIRRFLWVVLAETIRTTSHSRTSTYKLHIRPEAERAALQAPLAVFARVLARNLEAHERFGAELARAGRLNGLAYRGEVAVRAADTTVSVEGTYDLVVTSPPYGDNATTVPYGQASYLALQWIDPEDIGAAFDRSLCASPYATDGRSVGGARKRPGWEDQLALLRRRSAEFGRSVAALRAEPADRARRVARFCVDLDRCVKNILDATRPGGLLVWTVGNRRVAGRMVPTDAILRELLESHGAVHITRIDRRIPSKRMASRNGTSATMRAEHTLVCRRL